MDEDRSRKGTPIPHPKVLTNKLVEVAGYRIATAGALALEPRDVHQCRVAAVRINRLTPWSRKRQRR